MTSFRTPTIFFHFSNKNVISVPTSPNMPISSKFLEKTPTKHNQLSVEKSKFGKFTHDNDVIQDANKVIFDINLK
jgi:hypothetical protein